MPYRRRSRKRRSLRRFVKRAGLVVATVLIVALCSMVVTSLLADEETAIRESPVRVATVDIQEPGASSEIGDRYYGLCSKNSIRTVEDFRRTVQQDPLLAAHFAGFRWENAKLGQLDKAVWTFVSYRNGNAIRRTTKPVRLPEGDGYITDGVRTVRTLCCNDYVLAPPPAEAAVAAPPEPVERVDGPPRRLNKSVEWVDGPPFQQSTGAVSEESAGAIPGSLEKVSYYSVPFYSHVPSTASFREFTSSRHKPHEPIVTPEPGTIYLMGGGVAAIALLRLVRRKRDAAGKE